jgi:hypothetical protein
VALSIRHHPMSDLGSSLLHFWSVRTETQRERSEESYAPLADLRMTRAGRTCPVLKRSYDEKGEHDPVRATSQVCENQVNCVRIAIRQGHPSACSGPGAPGARFGSAGSASPPLLVNASAGARCAPADHPRIQPLVVPLPGCPVTEQNAEW